MDVQVPTVQRATSLENMNDWIKEQEALDTQLQNQVASKSSPRQFTAETLTSEKRADNNDLGAVNWVGKLQGKYTIFLLFTLPFYRG